MPDTPTDQIPDERIALLDGAGALAQVSRAEVDVQISTAKRYPRSVGQFKKELMELATSDEETAASMFYAYERGGKLIEGPSVRLAELVALTWGNLRSSSRTIAADETYVTAQGAAFDLERNVAIAFEVKRRITDKYGRRYNDDMIGVTAQAAMAIAFRNAIFHVVPPVLYREAYQESRTVAIGKSLTMEQRRTKALSMFAKLGVKPEAVLAKFKRAKVDDLTIDDVTTLRGIFTAVRDGQTTADEEFPAPASPGAATAPPKTLKDLTAKMTETADPRPAIEIKMESRTLAPEAPEPAEPPAPPAEPAPVVEPPAPAPAESPMASRDLAGLWVEVDVVVKQKALKKALVEYLMGLHCKTTKRVEVTDQERVRDLLRALNAIAIQPKAKP